MQFILKPFLELSAKELYHIYFLRNEVFVVEQNCAYQDVDEKDLSAFHYLLYDSDKLAAYCRILPPSISYKQCSIGRVVVSPHYRKTGLGKLLMKNCISVIQQKYSHEEEIVISAQTYLQKFYNELGFTEQGNVYLEDNIPHIVMRLKLLPL